MFRLPPKRVQALLDFWLAGRGRDTRVNLASFQDRHSGMRHVSVITAPLLGCSNGSMPRWYLDTCSVGLNLDLFQLDYWHTW